MQALEEDTHDGLGPGDADETLIEEDATLTGEPRAQPLSFTRGMNPRAQIAWVLEHHGDEGVRMLQRALPPETIDALGGPALRPGNMTWVPFMANAVLLETIDAVFGGGDLRLAVDVGRFMANRDFPLLARPVARLLSPRIGISMATKIWRLYHSHGAWEIVPGERELLAVLYGRTEIHPAFCAGMRGWIEGAFLVCGATEAFAVEERCMCRGAPVCSLRIEWKERRDSPRGRVPRPPS